MRRTSAMLMLALLGGLPAQASAQLSQQGPKLVGTGMVGTTYQGSSVAVSADGNTAIVGGLAGNSGVGSARIYVRSGGAWTQQGATLVGTGATGTASQGRSVALSADGNTAMVGGPNDAYGVGAAWVFRRSGSVWSQQGDKLVGSGPVDYAGQGTAVALSADGNTAVVGGPLDDSRRGAVWVFTRAGGLWSQQGAKLVGNDIVDKAQHGEAVAASADGNTIVVGGNRDNTWVGAAWVYVRSAGTWSQQGAKLIGAGATGAAALGISVAVSGDGNTAVVGGWGDNSNAGATWVFTRSGSAWSQQGAKLVGTGAIGGVSYQGVSVSVSSDGNTVVAGGHHDNSSTGAAWVFTRSGNAWSQQGGKLVGSGAVGAGNQGYAVRVSGNGATIFVGGFNDDWGSGAAWVYTRSGTTWSQQGSKLVPADTVGAAQQGTSVGLSADGGTAVVGGPYDHGGVGAAWVFKRSGIAWTQQGAKLVGTGASTNTISNLGISIAAAADGNTLLVGASADNANAGAAWVFVRSGGTWSQQGAKLLGTGAGVGAGQGCSVALSADGNTALVAGRGDGSGVGATWVFTRSGGAWAQQGAKLVGTGGVGAPYQGSSVALSADGNTAIVGGAGDHTNAGAAWIFTRSAGVWSQQGAKLIGTGAVGGYVSQGYSVAISADGNTALVAGPGDTSGAGAAWVFTRSGGVWSQQGAKLVGTGATGLPYLGWSVALSGDGTTAILGGRYDASSAGAAWVFKRSGSAWSQRGAKIVGSGAVGSAAQGFAVALSNDGSTALVGGTLDAMSKGATWVLAQSGAPATATLKVTRSGTGTGTVSSNPSGITCGATCSAVFAAGTVVTLTASAATGSGFTAWSGDCTGQGPCQVTMSQARNVGATFSRAVHLRRHLPARR